ncbi:4-hydroxyacetophenone monooxygenase [Mycobacteroides stephanolepidis]|uniref:4-hydroxyacetophenone monooxygenase n=1 Tax=[Mycobacterium] stephanolepidis TaxID=1520670 RepID=A0A1Z4ETB4_9MYCO|nr:NAD(P)/FAD-dependent oxidoreductase [[Mycobacterium] stephanolepidis]BAX96195.1 4-hydroxyacetophenone monooxygenase [[Mycobacterium] stephanolepidis]
MATSVAIIGCGFGGLAAAIELKRSGITDFGIFERAASIGGVWRENTYPGAACDVPSPIYSFSYALKPDWSSLFGRGAEIRSYLEAVADEFGLRPHMEFDTEVTAATYDDTTGRWTLEFGPDRPTRIFDVVIMATGQLSRPRLPAVEGIETFEGPSFHSAEFDHSTDLTGKKVAVIGSGASAIQLVPAIADRVAELTVLQRSPNWVIGKSRRVHGRLQVALLRRSAWLRKQHHNLLFLAYESRWPLVTRKVRPVRWAYEHIVKFKIRRHISDPAERAAAVPDYQMLCNRLLLSNDWYPTIGRTNVHLIGSAVEHVTATGIVTADGTKVDADALIWCTGFKASEFLAPIRISGRNGLDLREHWKSGAHAYLGMTTTGFPNMFMLFGPNTNSITNTIVFLLEQQAAYVRKAIEHKARHGIAAMEIREDVYRRFQEWMRRSLDKTVFTDNCPGWYTNAEGKVTAMWPKSHIEYALATRRFKADQYELEGVNSAD